MSDVGFIGLASVSVVNSDMARVCNAAMITSELAMSVALLSADVSMSRLTICVHK